ncbi:MAG: aconitase family protein, partial [Candidatus Zixiibacteriota bacterium]
MTTHPMTLTEKILADHAIGHCRNYVRPGDIIRISVDWTIASELAWNGMNQTYERLGRPEIHNKERFYLAIDHTVDPVTITNDPRTQRLIQLSKAFASEAQLKRFYDSNETILHTKFYRDLVLPGEVVLGADSHTSSHGGLGAFAIGLGGADVTVAMTLGESWIEVPSAIAIEYRGLLPFGLGGKDVILKTLGTLGRNTIAMERSVEYVGDAVKEFSTDMRFTISNMTAEFGGLNGIFEPDGIVKAWIEQRDECNEGGKYFRADDDAEYAERRVIDLNNLAPQIAKPFSPDNTVDIDEVIGQKLDGCFIGACTTTEEELVLAGLILELALSDGMRVKQTRNRLVAPGDLTIEKNLREAGLLDVYEKAGFRIAPPGCHLCLGIASERAGEGELWLSSQNRNYQNRMGAGSLAWLSSAAVVAASAPDLELRDPRPYLARVDQERFRKTLGRTDLVRVTPDVAVSYATPSVDVKAKDYSNAPAHAVESGEDTPRERIHSRIQMFGDHIDTDAIIPGEFCHLSDLEEIGAKCFHYVRPEFVSRVKAGKGIVVAGEGWGSGSSREHAVWALKGAGVKLVIAKSYAFIHKRNLVNEALPFLQVTDDSFFKLVKENDEL